MSAKINSIQVNIKIPDLIVRHCTQNCSIINSKIFKCQNLKVLPIRSQSNIEIVADLFVHMGGYDHEFEEYKVRFLLVVYNSVKCKVLKNTFNAYYKNSWKNKVKILPRTENNASVLPEMDIELHEFSAMRPALNGQRSETTLRADEMTLQIELKSYNIVKPLPEETGNFILAISPEAIAQLEQDKNFKIICNGEHFYFNKTLLSLVSEVFQKMVQGNSKEAKENSVEINDFHPDTIRAFQKFSFGNETIQPEDLSVELLMFANRYFMKSLETKCKKHLVTVLEKDKDNLLDFIKIAYDLEDEEMLKIGANYFSKYKKELKGSEELKKFKKSNPDCMVRIYDIIFDE